ncbi:fibronectin type III domain-containing protein [Flavobacterium sp. AS60]|uniref:DUF7619 domain-containing protein n=1 Tax=Flavobacterium anseongense TaxID=2910677 RepID=UPI001F40DBDF|nr:fibronectin type III domain-containing protein [Flavobacterium sp. AS60]MCF6129199.1 fibronectin type III domain-containing protein [Flavobacterium sp. AS60]
MKKILLLTFSLFLGTLTAVHSQGCGGTFTDPAGPTANYAFNSDYTVTFCPENPGDVVTVTFTLFDIEAEWDALYVFDGPSIASPQISSANPAAGVPGGFAGGYWGTAIPGPFTSTSADGCLTFRFRSDNIINKAGWIAEVSCGPPTTCPSPVNPIVTSITATSAVLGWTDTSGATSWEVFALACGSAPPTASSVGQVVSVNPYVITGLTPGTCYNFYVRAICSPTDNSTLCVFNPVTTATLPPICGGQFIDNGGLAGNYTNSSDNTTTICPTITGDVVTVTFTSFNIETGYDALYVFNGNSLASAQIASSNTGGNVPGGLAGGYWGTTIPGPFTSTSADGCLTFRFRSDTSINRAGWVANVTCAPPPACSLPTALTINNVTSDSVTINWTQPPNPDSSVASAWQALLLPCGLEPSPSSTGFFEVATNPFTITGLNPTTCYAIYLRAVCSTSPLVVCPWVPFNPVTTIPAPPACGGQFFDNGGNGNYANNSDSINTICPTIPGEIVTVTFSSFNTETNWDALYVFDGNSITSPQIAGMNPAGNVPGGLAGGFWGTTIPGPFSSTSPDGCLTFRFRSDGSVTYPGWVANVTCAPDADKILLVAFVDQNSNGIRDTGEPLFPNGSFIYQQNSDGINVNGYSPTGQFALYDSNPANTYAFSYQIQPEYAGYYDSGTTTYNNISIPVGSATQFLYFPITLTNPYNDVTISIAPISPPRPGLSYLNQITYKNLGVAATGGTIAFVKPPEITVFGTTQTGTVTNGTGFTYAFTNLLPGETRIFYVTMTVPTTPTVSLGDLLTDSVTISAPANDIDLTNNANTNSQIVVNSYDPNDKMESRGKNIPISSFAEDDYFFYTIRFQNNGTADALDVRVEDVLNSQIDEETVRMVSSSHNYTMKRINNQLVWNFKNIHLPPSSVNPTGSIGYIQFKVQLNPGFQAGTIIPNNASIFFDSNPAIVTNTFSSKFTVPLSIADFDANSLVLYPNPAKHAVQIGLMNSNEQINKLVFYDVLGKVIKTVSSIVTESVTVDVSDLAKGVYLVEIGLDNNLKLTKKLIIQ